MGRFDSFLSEWIAAPDILAARLSRLIDRGIIRRRKSQGLAMRYEYRLTEAAKDQDGALVLRMAWGDRWLSQGRSPLQLTHGTCGKVFTPTVICDRRHKPTAASNMRYRPDWDPCHYEADSSEGRVHRGRIRWQRDRSNCHSATARG